MVKNNKTAIKGLLVLGGVSTAAASVYTLSKKYAKKLSSTTTEKCRVNDNFFILLYKPLFSKFYHSTNASSGTLNNILRQPDFFSTPAFKTVINIHQCCDLHIHTG